MSHFLSHWFVYESMFKIKPAVKHYLVFDVAVWQITNAVFHRELMCLRCTQRCCVNACTYCTFVLVLL